MDVEDIVRLVNAALFVACVGGMTVSPASPWRRSGSSARLTVTLVAALFLWQAWGSIEAVLQAAPGGSRGPGLAVLLVGILVSLIVDARRAWSRPRHRR